MEKHLDLPDNIVQVSHVCVFVHVMIVRLLAFTGTSAGMDQDLMTFM